MRLLLAAMEGLLDRSLRDPITRVGGVDLCVSEFIRITDQLLPACVFSRPCNQPQTRMNAGSAG